MEREGICWEGIPLMMIVGGNSCCVKLQQLRCRLMETRYKTSVKCVKGLLFAGTYFHSWQSALLNFQQEWCCQRVCWASHLSPQRVIGEAASQSGGSDSRELEIYWDKRHCCATSHRCSVVCKEDKEHVWQVQELYRSPPDWQAADIFDGGNRGEIVQQDKHVFWSCHSLVSYV